MQLNQQLKGALLVFMGAMSYGILATIVKYANNLGIHTSVLTFMQSFIGFAILTILALSIKQKNTSYTPPNKLKLVLFGTSFGMTSIFYYMAIQFIPVSMGIILLMQSIWMSVVLEAILRKRFPETLKIAGTITIIFGTLLATNVFFEISSIDWRGIALGMLAASSYTISLYASSGVETKSSPIIRSQYFVLGGLLFVMAYWNVSIIEHFVASEAFLWGTLLALFGTVIPPLLFTKGIPLVGIGIGAIIASVEIPVSILSAHLVLDERINWIQWLGVFIILVSVVLVNKPKRL
jgi:drug/metabolite transporter (DMT)-like permease